MFFLIKSLLLITVLGLALYHDVREKKIKNRVTIPAALAGGLISFAENGAAGLADSLQGWLVPVMALFILYYINVMGAGDVKLFAAIGSIMGLSFVFYSLLFSLYFGGLIALFILLARGIFVKRMKSVCRYFKYLFLTGRLVAYTPEDNSGAKFIFSTAVVPGTLLQLLLVLLRQI